MGSTDLEEEIRLKVQSGNYVVRPHAFREAFKDGVTFQNVKSVLLEGRVIEDYRPQRDECLMLGYTADRIPIHIAVNHETRVIVKTCYVPQTDKWLSDRIRKKKGSS